MLKALALACVGSYQYELIYSSVNYSGNFLSAVALFPEGLKNALSRLQRRNK